MPGTFGNTNKDGKFVPSKSYSEMLDEKDREIELLRAALEPFAEVARWAERNGHDLLNGWDMLLRQPDGCFAGHLQVQSPDFIAALKALNQQSTPEK